MFKYTAAKIVLAELKRIKQSKSTKTDHVYNATRALLHTHNLKTYTDHTELERCYSGMVFYSIEKRNTIPCGSVMFPASMFDITICS
jgi:hypothetical protein